DRAAMIIKFEGSADLGVLQLRKFSVIHHQERVVVVDIQNAALFKFGTAKEAFVVQTDHGDSLIVAALELDQGAANKKRHCVADLVHAAHHVQHVIRHGDGTGGSIDRRIHDPHFRPDIGDRRIRVVEDAGEHRGHHHHQKYGEG